MFPAQVLVSGPERGGQSMTAFSFKKAFPSQQAQCSQHLYFFLSKYSLFGKKSFKNNLAKTQPSKLASKNSKNSLRTTLLSPFELGRPVETHDAACKLVTSPVLQRLIRQMLIQMLQLQSIYKRQRVT